MPFILLSQAVAANCFNDIRLVATDMDGTLTVAGKFTPDFLQALTNLSDAGIDVVIVTGRSAGWVSGLVNYLPVWGAIAENGGLLCLHHSAPRLLVPISDFTWHRQQLAYVFQRLQLKFPHLKESDDNRFRLTDWTFDVQGLLVHEIQQIDDLCRSWGWGFTYSTVQGHIKPLQQDKAKGVLQVLSRYFPDYTTKQVVTVGDSPNDESLFNSAAFPCSVGVANVQEYRDRLVHQPAFITTAAEGEGFLELSDLLLQS